MLGHVGSYALQGVSYTKENGDQPSDFLGFQIIFIHTHTDTQVLKSSQEYQENAFVGDIWMDEAW